MIRFRLMYIDSDLWRMSMEENEKVNIDENSKKSKLLSLLRLIGDDVWGLLLLIVVVVIIKLVFREESHMSGFIAGVACGAVVWLVLYKKKHWLFPIGYMLIIFAFLITRRAVEVGIAGFYLNEWYMSTELMLVISTIGVIVLFKLVEIAKGASDSYLWFRIMSAALAVLLMFFIGANSAKKRDKQQIFSKTSVMMIQQLFNMRGEINNILQSNEEIDIDDARLQLNFSFNNVTILLESFYHKDSGVKNLNRFMRNEAEAYLFSYEEGVTNGKFKVGVSDEERLRDIREFCSGLAGDLNAAAGDMRKTENILSDVNSKFYAIIENE